MAAGLVLVGPADDALDALLVLDRLAAAGRGFAVLGRVADEPPTGAGTADGPGVALLGHLDDLGRLGVDLYHAVDRDPGRRRAAVERLPAHQRAPVLVDPAALISARCELAAGTRIDAHGCVSVFAVLGRHVLVASGGMVGHDAVIGDFVSIGPGAALMGGVVVGDGAAIGARASVLEEIRIGAGAVVEPGAVVTRDVPDGVRVAGIPARPVAEPAAGPARSR